MDSPITISLHQRGKQTHSPQDVPLQTPADARAGAGVGGGLVALSRALQHGVGAADHLLERARRLSLALPPGEAELKDLRAAIPEYAAIHSHVLQDVLARLDKTYQGLFRRLARGEKAGFPRFQGRDRYHSFT